MKDSPTNNHHLSPSEMSKEEREAIIARVTTKITKEHDKKHSNTSEMIEPIKEENLSLEQPVELQPVELQQIEKDSQLEVEVNLLASDINDEANQEILHVDEEVELEYINETTEKQQEKTQSDVKIIDGEMNWAAVKDDSFKEFFTTSAINLPKAENAIEIEEKQGFFSKIKNSFAGLFRGEVREKSDDFEEGSSLFFPGDDVHVPTEFIAEEKAYDTKDLNDQTLQFDLSMVNDPIVRTQEILFQKEEEPVRSGKITFINSDNTSIDNEKLSEANNFEIIEPVKTQNPEIEEIIIRAQEQQEVNLAEQIAQEIELASREENNAAQKETTLLETSKVSQEDTTEEVLKIVSSEETEQEKDIDEIAGAELEKQEDDNLVAEQSVKPIEQLEIETISENAQAEISQETTINQQIDKEQIISEVELEETCVFEQVPDSEVENNLSQEEIGEISFSDEVVLSNTQSNFEINLEQELNQEISQEISQETKTEQEQKSDNFLKLGIGNDVKQNAEEKAAAAVLKLFGKEEKTTTPSDEFEPSSPFEESKPKQNNKKDEEDQDLLAVAKDMQSLCAVLNLRIALTGILSFGMLILGFMAQDTLQAVEAISPAVNPALFLWINIVLLVAVMAISYNTIIEGVLGLWKKPSTDTLPTIAAIASLLQLLVFVLNAKTFAKDANTAAIFASLAGFLLMTNTIGNRILAGVVYENYNFLKSGFAKFAAYRLDNKDLKRELMSKTSKSSDEILLNRPAKHLQGFLDQSFSDRLNEKQLRMLVYGFIGVAFTAGIITIIRGDGFIGFASAFSAVLCIGAPLSSSLVSALPCLFMQKATLAKGAIIPGWQSVDELGKIDVIYTDAKELFPAGCAQLFGIKTFQKERLDMAILYATSILIEACDLLSDLFANMIEHKMEMLYPVKDLENRRGLGFVAWCENYRVLLGTRELMEQEGVSLPPMDYEERYSKAGLHQVLYLAVSGQLYAMFLIGYKGEVAAARIIRVLRKENIRLMVKCDDPSLTAQRIEKRYKLPEGFIHITTEQDEKVIKPLTTFKACPKGMMMHTGQFASFINAIKAAAGADSAQRSAAAVQIISIMFSAMITLFLALFGGLIGVSLVAAILYQVAWSALSLGLIFTKKFS